MITESVDIDWLDSIAGLTVADAIEYLRRLDQSHTLSYGLEGDTHGVEVTSCLHCERKETPQELEQLRQKRLAKQIVDAQNARDYYLKEEAYYAKAGRADRAAAYRKYAENQIDKLKTLQSQT